MAQIIKSCKHHEGYSKENSVIAIPFEMFVTVTFHSHINELDYTFQWGTVIIIIIMIFFHLN